MSTESDQRVWTSIDTFTDFPASSSDMSERNLDDHNPWVLVDIDGGEPCYQERNSFPDDTTHLNLASDKKRHSEADSSSRQDSDDNNAVYKDDSGYGSMATSVASLDTGHLPRRKRVSQVQSYRLTEATRNRLGTLPLDPKLAAEHVQGVRKQLSASVGILVEELKNLQGQEQEMMHFEIALLSDAPLHAEEDQAIQQEKVMLGCVEHQAERYIHRLGDASITGERIGELDYQMALWQSRQGEGGGSLLEERELIVAYGMRRQALEMELQCALQDVESLRTACLAQGHDPERLRHR